MKQTLARDCLVVTATGMVGYGLWLITPAAMFIGVGLLILGGLLNGSKTK